MPEWVSCRDREPPVPPGFLAHKSYRVVIDNPVDLYQLRSDGAEAEVTAGRDSLGWFVERGNDIIDIKPSRWLKEDECSE